MLKAAALIERFEQTDELKQIWFSDEASFYLSPPLNSQNERIYREVLVNVMVDFINLFVLFVVSLFSFYIFMCEYFYLMLISLSLFYDISIGNILLMSYFCLYVYTLRSPI